MIVKIQPLASNITNALRYNENKSEAKEGCLSPDEELEYLKNNSTGHILATFNVPEPSTLQNEFARLKMLNERNARGRKLLNPTLHISVNPGEKDRKLSEAEVVDFIVEVMDKLGYGETPYRIYRHDDNGRTHYHIVGIRIGQDGKKIRDNYENKHCEKICRDLAQKYDYIYGLEGVKGIEEQTGKTDAVASDNKPDEELHPESEKTSVIGKEGANTANKDKRKKEKSTVGRFDLKSPVGQAPGGYEMELLHSYSVCSSDALPLRVPGRGCRRYGGGLSVQRTEQRRRCCNHSCYREGVGNKRPCRCVAALLGYKDEQTHIAAKASGKGRDRRG